MDTAAPYAVLGAGSWGTALALQLVRNHRGTRLWGRDSRALADLDARRENRRYLPGFPLPDSLVVTDDLALAIEGAGGIILAVPAEALRGTLEAAIRRGLGHLPILIATKGMESTTALLMHEVARAVRPRGPLALLSGPSFAREVAAGLPTAVTVASEDTDTAQKFAEAFHGSSFRIYLGQDLPGVALGGAVKNVIAIGAGLSDGLAMGANARAALITRGLAELVRLGLREGARLETFMGLSGVGDLMLTATDDQSRNHRLGRLLAQGVSLEAAQARIGQVTEGMQTLPALQKRRLAARVEMPITDALDAILNQGADPRRTLERLLERSRTTEFPGTG